MSAPLSSRPWTADEIEVLRTMVMAGHTNAAIAERLPGRSYQAVKNKRPEFALTSGNNRRGAFRPRAAAASRIAALTASIEREMAERRPDWLLIDELIGGLLWLQARQA
jgi:hypothetical protein